ncbi:MAG: pentapeptide repeat-containing protein [Cyanobacteriota bacterium]|nr:pentapeptide repeat-containing protein [Cyanobacteriota bacterium]
MTIPGRRERQIQEARQVLRQEADHEYSEGRIEALKVLSQRCASNPGLEAKDAHLEGLKLKSCKRFFPSHLLPSRFQGASMNLSNSNLEGAILVGADLRNINLQGSNLRRANLEGANLQGVNLTGADLRGANLAGANLQNAQLKGCQCDESNFYGAQLQETDFSEASLVEIKALWANFQNANFRRANLQSANLNRTQLEGADFYKADLKKASLRFADLKSQNRLKLQSQANFLEANLEEADLWGAQFWSDFQLKGAKKWETTHKANNWEQQIRHPREPRLRIALLKSEGHQSLFDAYELGMRRAANRRVEIWGVKHKKGDQNEAKAIEYLVGKGIDAIVLTPEHPKRSMETLKKAQDAGVAIITVDFCFDRADAEDFAIACYNTNSFKMGYDSGKYLKLNRKRWNRKNQPNDSTFRRKRSPQPIKMAMVDGAVYDRYYEYRQGFLKAVDEINEERSDVSFEIVDAVSVRGASEDPDRVLQMLEDHPEIELLWGGSNLATEVALQALKRSDTKKQVEIFGILDLWIDKATKLLDPDSPLKLVIDQSGVRIGAEAVKTAVEVLRGERSGKDYKECTVEHRLLLQEQEKAVKSLLVSEFGSIDEKWSLPVQKQQENDKPFKCVKHASGK